MVSLDGPEGDRVAAQLLRRKSGSQAGAGRDAGISPSTMNALFGPEPYRLRNREDAERLHAAAWEFVAMPWSDGHQRFRASVINDLEAASCGSKDAIERVRRQHLFSAKHEWGPAALDSTRPVAERLFKGLLCLRTVFDCRWKISHMPEKDSLGPLVEKVASVLLDLVSSDPEGWFDGVFGQSEHNGARFTRLLVTTAATGLFLKGSKRSREEKIEYMKRLAAAAFLSDSIWAERLCPGEIARLYNAWVVAMMAGRWRPAAFIGQLLLGRYGAILESEVAGVTPLVDDKEVWPGLAAMLVLLPNSSRKLMRLRAIAPHTNSHALLQRLGKVDGRLFLSKSYAEVFEKVVG